MPRTATVTLPYITALASANSAPIWIESAPGLVTISTPKKPSQQERTSAPAPARSLSQRIDRSAAHSGAEKMIAIGARERHQHEGNDSEGLRDRLRQAARDVRVPMWLATSLSEQIPMGSAVYVYV